MGLVGPVEIHVRHVREPPNPIRNFGHLYFHDKIIGEAQPLSGQIFCALSLEELVDQLAGPNDARVARD